MELYKAKNEAQCKHCVDAPVVWLQQTSSILFLRGTELKLVRLEFSFSILNFNSIIIATGSGLPGQQKGSIRPPLTNQVSMS